MLTTGQPMQMTLQNINALTEFLMHQNFVSKAGFTILLTSINSVNMDTRTELPMRTKFMSAITATVLTTKISATRAHAVYMLPMLRKRAQPNDAQGLLILMFIVLLATADVPV